MATTKRTDELHVGTTQVLQSTVVALSSVLAPDDLDAAVTAIAHRLCDEAPDAGRALIDALDNLDDDGRFSPLVDTLTDQLDL